MSTGAVASLVSLESDYESPKVKFLGLKESIAIIMISYMEFRQYTSCNISEESTKWPRFWNQRV